MSLHQLFDEMAFTDGQLAALAGEPLDACPHDPEDGARVWRGWQAGWRRGRGAYAKARDYVWTARHDGLFASPQAALNRRLSRQLEKPSC